MDGVIREEDDGGGWGAGVERGGSGERGGR